MEEVPGNNQVLSIEKISKDIIVWINKNRSTDEEEFLLDADTALLDDGVFNSIKILEFIVWLEKTYDIIINVEQMTPDFFSSPGIIAKQIIELQNNS